MNINKIKNTTKEYRDIEDLRQLPLAIRQDKETSNAQFDTLYDNRKINDYIQRFMKVKVPISDREFGSPQEQICNIYMNLTSDKSTNDLIDEYTFNRQWTYHPVKSFEMWNHISKLHYGEERLYWVILLFNKIHDPFTALSNFNMVRIPELSFATNLKYRWDII